jgi:type I restriction enzyme S subunit
MDLKRGYKQTEVGVIPEDWDVQQLKSRVAIAHGYPFSSMYFCDLGAYRLTTPGHFYESGGFRDIGDKQKFYDGPVPADYVLRTGDLIVAMTEQADGLLGSAAMIPSFEGYLHNQRLGRVRALSPAIELGFLFYVFNSPGYRAKVRETAAGTKVKHTSPEKLLEIPVRLPPACEQRAIAGVLGDVDALIGALDRLITKKRDLKQAAMQQLLTGQTRLPGFSGKWEDVVIGETAEKVGSGITPTGGIRVYKATGRPFLRSQNVGWGTLLLDDVVFIDDSTHQSFVATEIEVGDVLLNITGASIGRSAVADARIKGGNVNQHVCIIRPKARELHPVYLNYFLLSTGGQEQIDSFQAGGNRQGLNFGQIRSFRLRRPSFDEQSAIASVLSDMDSELSALEERRDKTRLLKQGMMQELLTGRIRLS